MYSRNIHVVCRFTVAVIVAVSAASLHVSAASPNPKLWKWTKDADHLDSVVKIFVDNAQATGVVVRVNSNRKKANGVECHILTAYHVVESQKQKDEIRIRFRNGKEIADGEVLAFDDRRDIALVKTWAPKGVAPASVATTSVEHKMYIEFVGLGGAANLKKSMRHFSSKATQPTNGNFIYADETLLPGDSGGPVFNSRRELVGIISGGWFWWDAGIKSTDGIPILSTWPARASNVDAIQKLLDQVEQVQVASTKDAIVEK